MTPCPPAHPFPPQGPLGQVPRLNGTTQCSGSLSPFSSGFVAFALRYRPSPVCFAPHGSRRSPHEARVLFHRSPFPVAFRRRRKGLPGFCRTLCPHALFFDPGGTPMLIAAQHQSAAFRENNRVGSHKQYTFEAQSHGLWTPCVRFAAWVTPSPRNTRF